MNCFACFVSQRSWKCYSKRHYPSPCAEVIVSNVLETRKHSPGGMDGISSEISTAETYKIHDLAAATQNFHKDHLLGEGRFGRVYRGLLASTGLSVAVKQLDRNGLPGHAEFVNEVSLLTVLHHPNLVRLIGYCADGDQRLLVYELMSGGCLKDHLLDLSPRQKPLDWFVRMKIALGTAKVLEYLHEKVDPPLVYCKLKPSNVLLDEDFNPKLSHFRLAKLGLSLDRPHFSSRLMPSYGYCAPEYARGDLLTPQFDVYSFGVILLELISGRKATDLAKPPHEQNLVSWFPSQADSRLSFIPEKALNQVVAIAAMCLQEEPASRPLMSDVVKAMTFLPQETTDSAPYSPPLPPPPPVVGGHESDAAAGCCDHGRTDSTAASHPIHKPMLQLDDDPPEGQPRLADGPSCKRGSNDESIVFVHTCSGSLHLEQLNNARR